jgi:dTDP-4-dehydrorhamnose 3,5-epimerase
VSSRFNFIATPLSGLYKAERMLIEDQRGFLSRLFCTDDFKDIGFEKAIVQINHTLTYKKGVIRGMHYQNPPHTEAKIITCTHGEIYDVVVDLRKDSPTFLEWHSEILSATNQNSLVIPEGFAHGFQTLSKECNLLYMHSNFFTSESEAIFNVLDPRLAITWPIKITEMSERDKYSPMMSDIFEGIEII